MASSPEVEASQFDVSAVYTAESTNVFTSQFDVTAVFNIPSVEIQAAQFDLTLVTISPPREVEVSQLDLIVVYKGRVDDPVVRAWTFTLDGHDFYVLRLGNVETLVYDTLAQQWYVWGSGESNLWRAYTGINWIGGTGLALNSSSAVVGDDGNGSLYFLSPEKTTDDDAIDPDVRRTFTREITSQFTIDSGYQSVPCFGIQVFGSVGQQAGGVSLSLSDDRGLSYYGVGTFTVPADALDQRLNWQSLGSMTVPGRLFRIRDDGALKRIDGVFIEGMSEE